MSLKPLIAGLAPGGGGGGGSPSFARIAASGGDYTSLQAAYNDGARVMSIETGASVGDLVIEDGKTVFLIGYGSATGTIGTIYMGEGSRLIGNGHQWITVSVHGDAPDGNHAAVSFEVHGVRLLELTAEGWDASGAPGHGDTAENGTDGGSVRLVDCEIACTPSVAGGFGQTGYTGDPGDPGDPGTAAVATFTASLGYEDSSNIQLDGESLSVTRGADPGAFSWPTFSNWSITSGGSSGDNTATYTANAVGSGHSAFSSGPSVTRSFTDGTDEIPAEPGENGGTGGNGGAGGNLRFDWCHFDPGTANAPNVSGGAAGAGGAGGTGTPDGDPGAAGSAGSDGAFTNNFSIFEGIGGITP